MCKHTHTPVRFSRTGARQRQRNSGARDIKKASQGMERGTEPGLASHDHVVTSSPSCPAGGHKRILRAALLEGTELRFGGSELRCSDRAPMTRTGMMTTRVSPVCTSLSYKALGENKNTTPGSLTELHDNTRNTKRMRFCTDCHAPPSGAVTWVCMAGFMMAAGGLPHRGLTPSSHSIPPKGIKDVGSEACLILLSAMNQNYRSQVHTHGSCSSQCHTLSGVLPPLAGVEGATHWLLGHGCGQRWAEESREALSRRTASAGKPRMTQRQAGPGWDPVSSRGRYLWA